FNENEAQKDTWQSKVLLIDEIDKANIDFPNDLLLELDEKRFFIDEVKTFNKRGEKQRKEVRAPETARPIIIITSNNEKELPAAFLRRCLFYHIAFPHPHTLEQIIHSHFESANTELVQQAIDTFYHLHAVMGADDPNRRKVSTSELLDWFKVIHHKSQKDDAFQESIFTQLDQLPFPSILLKSFKEHQAYLVEQKHLKNLPQKSHFTAND
ncbi:MAG: MoxR family ATPase, partial [Bacteroidota bacterium]